MKLRPIPDENRDLVYIKLFTGFIAAIIFVLILKQLQNVFLPLCLAILLYFLFNGAMKKITSSWFLTKIIPLKLQKILILVAILFFIFFIFYFLGVLLFSMASSFIEKFPGYSQKIGTFIAKLPELLNIPMKDVNQYISHIDWSKTINTITTVVSSTFGSFAAFMGNLVLVVIFLMFMLAGRESLPIRLRKTFETKGDAIISILDSIEDQVRRYLLIKLFISLLTAIVCGFILFLGAFDFVIFSAFLIFILNFIPNFGSVVATAFPVCIGVINYGFSLRVLIVTAALIIVQNIIGNVLEPQVTGKKLNLSPIVILIALICWGWIWGIVGMILAVPLMSAIKIIFENIESLKPVASLISAD